MTNKEMEKVGTEVVQRRNAKVAKKTGGEQHSSVESTTTATRPEISEILKNSLYWRGRPRVVTDDECAERLNEFFNHCAETGEIPTVEKMALALGVTRVRLWQWAQGEKGAVRQNMIQMAKEILASMDAELVSRNKIPQVTYIFRAKNYFGMSNKTEVVVTPNNPLEASVGKEELQARYELNAPEDDDND